MDNNIPTGSLNVLNLQMLYGFQKHSSIYKDQLLSSLGKDLIEQLLFSF